MGRLVFCGDESLACVLRTSFADVLPWFPKKGLCSHAQQYPSEGSEIAEDDRLRDIRRPRLVRIPGFRIECCFGGRKASSRHLYGFQRRLQRGHGRACHRQGRQHHRVRYRELYPVRTLPHGDAVDWHSQDRGDRRCSVRPRMALQREQRWRRGAVPVGERRHQVRRHRFRGGLCFDAFARLPGLPVQLHREERDSDPELRPEGVGVAGVGDGV